MLFLLLPHKRETSGNPDRYLPTKSPKFFDTKRTFVDHAPEKSCHIFSWVRIVVTSFFIIVIFLVRNEAHDDDYFG